MAKLLGTKPNQAPTNNDLGDLAYQDMDKLPTINVADDGFVVTEDGDVGIGTAFPSEKLEVGGSIKLDGDITTTVNLFDIKVTAGNTGSFVAIDFPELTDEPGTVRFFRTTNTTGAKNFDINRGDNTSTVDHRLAAGSSANSFLAGSGGNVGIGTTTPSQKLDVNGDSIRVRTAKTPASASDTGTQGQIAWDADYIYICVATDTWKRAAISTW